MKKTGAVIFLILLLVGMISPLALSGFTINEENVTADSDTPHRATPRVSKPTGNGPYSTSYVTVTLPRSDNTTVGARIYYPGTGSNVTSNGAPYHGVVFAPGAGGYETDYVSQLRQIASWGYIITIVGTGGPCNQDVVDTQSDVLDYYEAENANSSSIFYNNIDTFCYGASGHSNGGWAAIAGAVADSRFTAISPLFFKYWLNGEKDYGTFIYGEEMQKDIAANKVQYTSEVGLEALPSPSEVTVYEDEWFEYSGEGVITEPTGPNRTIVLYEWDLESDGIYDKNYTTKPTKMQKLYWYEGTYQITLRVTDSWGMMATGAISITVNNVYPVADAGVNQVGIEDEEINFNANQSYDTPSDMTMSELEYRWDFGDGNSTGWSTETTRSHIYTLKGEYVTSLYVRDDDEAVDIDQIIITIDNLPPTARFKSNKTKVRIGEEIKFDATSSYDTITDNDSLVYYWEFGDYKSALGNITTHSYAEEGNYKVILTVVDNDGDQDTVWLTIIVLNSPPSCKAMKDQVIEEDEIIEFTGSGEDTELDRNSLMYSWNFGVPGVPNTPCSDESEFKFIYKTEGNYTAVLTVIDNDGATSSDSVQIEVQNVEPTAEFIASSKSITEDETIKFDASTSTDTESDLKTLNYTWTLSSGPAFGFGKQVENKFTESGTYSVTLIVVDDNHDHDTYVMEIEVENSPPTAVISSSVKKVDVDTPIFFSAVGSSDTPSDLGDLEYKWTFGDDTDRFGILVNHSYDEPGKYDVILTVSDGESEVTAQLEIIVTEPEIKEPEKKETKNDDSLVFAAGVGNVVIILILIILLLLYLKSSSKSNKKDIYQ